MAKRTSNESSISEVLQQFIQVNRLEAGMDKIDVEQAWKNLMGNGVQLHTRSDFKRNNFVCETHISCFARRAKLRKTKNHNNAQRRIAKRSC